MAQGSSQGQALYEYSAPRFHDFTCEQSPAQADAWFSQQAAGSAPTESPAILGPHNTLMDTADQQLPGNMVKALSGATAAGVEARQETEQENKPPLQDQPVLKGSNLVTSWASAGALLLSVGRTGTGHRAL